MKKVFLIISGILVFISVPVIVFFLGQQQELRTKAAPATTLTIEPSSATIPIGETVICKVMINTNGNSVASAKISIAFDQSKFEAQSITNGSLAPRILNQGTVGVGTASITVAAENTTKPIMGQGEIATVRLKAVGGSATPVQVRFGADTFVAGIGEKIVNVLVSNQPASITISGGTIEPLADTSTNSVTPPITITSTIPPTPLPTRTVTIAPTQPIQPTAQLEALVAEPQSAAPIGGTDISDTTGDEMPTSGSTEITLLLIMAGTFLLSTGVFSFIQKSNNTV